MKKLTAWGMSLVMAFSLSALGCPDPAVEERPVEDPMVTPENDVPSEVDPAAPAQVDEERPLDDPADAPAVEPVQPDEPAEPRLDAPDADDETDL